MDVLFWSGGKDAYLAHEFYRRQYPDRKLKLLTTFDDDRQLVPHQQIPVENIQKQAGALDLELILVPLPSECPNDIYLNNVGNALKNQDTGVEHLVFGDWHLQDIKEWREQQFEPMGYNCLFPIWEKSLHDLLPVLLLKPIEVKITSVDDDYRKYIRPGELYNQRFIQQLPEEIDPMGENGEFHTEVIFKSWQEEHKPKRQPLY